MWDDIKIGKGSKGNSAIVVFDIKGDHGISENSFSFWISNCYLGMGMTIMKDTPEGAELQAFIARKASLDEVQPWLDEIALKHVDRGILKAKIDQAISIAYEDGSTDRARKIRKAMGV